MKQLALVCLAFSGSVAAVAPTWYPCIPGQGLTYCTDINDPLVKTISFFGEKGKSEFNYETNSLVVCDPNTDCVQVASNETFGRAPAGLYLVAGEYRLSVIDGETVAFWDGYGPYTAMQVTNYLREFGSSDLYIGEDVYDVDCTDVKCTYNGQDVSVDDLMFAVPMANAIGQTEYYRCEGPVCMTNKGERVFGLNPEFYAERYQ
jgi:hypothetical protein